MNLIVKFKGDQARDAFVARLEAARPDLVCHYRPAKTKPHAVMEDLTDEQSSWVLQSTQGLGQVFDDMQFQPLPPGLTP